jgi:hypothetical protein
MQLRYIILIVSISSQLRKVQYAEIHSVLGLCTYQIQHLTEID